MVIRAKFALGESICVQRFCENTVYEIKQYGHSNNMDISSTGSTSQCPASKNYLLKFIVPSEVRWFNIGTPITIFNRDCRAFLANDPMKNEVADMDYACSNNSFFLFHQHPGLNKCGSMFYVHQDMLFTIRINDRMDSIKFLSQNDSSPTVDVDLIVNNTATWCFTEVSKVDIKAREMTNHLMPYCKYYMYQTGYSSSVTSNTSSTTSELMVAENQISMTMPSQAIGEQEHRRRKCGAKRMMEEY
uniref:Uncharacterized protein n=1 Tax=Romanomermis culicivorax TaxID=13658 RepID=A0A915KRH9_ROMCU